MRGRLIIILLAILVVSGFAALNWQEVTRTTPLSFGVSVSEAPLGLILLMMLAATLVFFLLSTALLETRRHVEYGRHQRTLEAQRELADKAEASRFTDLRQQLDSHLRENRQRETIAATEFEKSMVQSQRELRNQLESMNQTLATRLREFESRIDARIDRLQGATAAATAQDGDPLKRDHIRL